MSVADLPTPALVVDADALAHNLDTMTARVARRPAAAARESAQVHRARAGQAARGHYDFTCATPREIVGMAAARLGDDLLLANQTVDARRLRAMADTGARVTVAVDSAETIDAAADERDPRGARST